MRPAAAAKVYTAKLDVELMIGFPPGIRHYMYPSLYLTHRPIVGVYLPLWSRKIKDSYAYADHLFCDTASLFSH